ncbi:bifunctional deaminase-reductase domain protein [Sandaracinus amylolyticus]|uniref:Bifunctional deaminase-reductase domain protein n=2 Tax=Sandaracinus amylolyticus TaxID=927083 RepID=A0A0F6W0Y4_9BACT|nr:bifunctional deaminase-reductase domain protein [Sandaracinus amylolyticus]
MVPSVDGRIVTDRWDLPPTFVSEYERTAATFGADAWMIGRISMEPYAGKATIPRRAPAERIPRTDFVARRDASSYAIVVDPGGKLRWTSSDIDGEHVITVLTEGVEDAYLAFLRSKGVSYVFGGRTEIDLGRALARLRASFGIETLLLEGGGKINGSFLDEDLVDELSVIVAPVVDGSVGTPTLFDRSSSRRSRASTPRHFELVSVERLPSDLVWIRYRRRR